MLKSASRISPSLRPIPRQVRKIGHPLTRRALLFSSAAILCSKVKRAFADEYEVVLTREDVLYFYECQKLGELLDEYMSVINENDKLGDALCHDEYFKALLTSYDQAASKVNQKDVRNILHSRFANLGVDCEVMRV